MNAGRLTDQQVVKRIHEVAVTLVPHQDVILTSWSGCLAARIVFDTLRKRGIVFRKKERKPFITYPLLRFDGTPIFSGFTRRKGDMLEPSKFGGYAVIKSGEPVVLKAVFLREDITETFVNELPATISVPSGKFSLIRLEANRIDLQRNSLTETVEKLVKTQIALIKVKFWAPTCFCLSGVDITYPSPMRFTFSILKNLAEVSRDTISTKYVALKLATAIDLLSPKMKAVKKENKIKIISDYKWILVDIGEGRIQPAFIGRALYVLSTIRLTVEELNLLVKALELAKYTGVGISKTIGFGKIDYTITSISQKNTRLKRKSPTLSQYHKTIFFTTVCN